MKRHVILTLGRSGSNTLVNLLNQHPDILNVGEVLGPWNRVRQLRDRLRLYPDDTAGYLDAITQVSGLTRAMSAGRTMGRLLHRKPGKAKPLSRVATIGFKEFATLMHEQGQENWLRDRPDIKVIGLVRENILGRLVSWKLLEQTGVVARGDKAAHTHPTLTIAPDTILGLLNMIAAENQTLRTMLEDLPKERVYVVNYDDFYKDEVHRERIMTEIFAALGMQPFPTVIRMKKIVAVPPAEMIANRQACAEVLKGTAFEGIL